MQLRGMRILVAKRNFFDPRLWICPVAGGHSAATIVPTASLGHQLGLLRFSSPVAAMHPFTQTTGVQGRRSSG